jgi:hypothetical protein
MDLDRGDQIKNDGKTDGGCNVIKEDGGRVETEKKEIKSTPRLRELSCLL